MAFFLSVYLIVGMLSLTVTIGQVPRDNEILFKESVKIGNSVKYMSDSFSKHIKVPLDPEDQKRLHDSVELAANIYRDARKSELFTDDRNDEVPSCRQLVFKTSADLAIGRAYASYMHDSNGRVESGELRGNYYWLGRYYECKGQTDGQFINARMCLIEIKRFQNFTPYVYLGQCYPDICDVDDVTDLVQDKVGYEYYLNTMCPEDLPLSAVEILSIVIFSFLGVLVLIGTTVEAVSSALNCGISSNVRKFTQILICFSVIKNTKAILNTKRKSSTIAVLDGIRFLSATWVILGHLALFYLDSIDNLVDIADFFLSHIGAQVLYSGTLAVDSFFFVSGLLVTYLSLREMKKRGGNLNIPIMYLHRYLRLTPAVLCVLLFAVGLYPRIGEGPIFELRNSNVVKKCQDYWWTIPLYINNLYPAENGDSCIAWLWYLGNDMQFFLLSPIFITLLYSKPKVGLSALAATVFASAAITGALTKHFEIISGNYFLGLFMRLIKLLSGPFPPIGIPPEGFNTSSLHGWISMMEDTESNDSYFNNIENTPWCRIGVYLIGMTTGYILFRTKMVIKMKKMYVLLGWLSAFSVSLAIVYGWWGDVKTYDPDHPPPQNVMAFYEAVRRPVWGFALMWLTIACSAGYGGQITKVLSWKAFIPLGRLSFAAYLIHPLCIRFMFTSRELDSHIRIDTFIYYYLAALTVSFSSAYLLSIFIELPTVEIQKMIFHSSSPSIEKNPAVKSPSSVDRKIYDDKEKCASKNEMYIHDEGNTKM